MHWKVCLWSTLRRPHKTSSALLGDALDQTGAITAAGRLTFSFTGGEAIGNGASSVGGNDVDASGIVLRVGTNDGGRAYAPTTDDGGFFAEGRGGMSATITGNTITGNNGADFHASSFLSTVDPATTAGTWDTTTPAFEITAFESDALARLDLTWSGNTVNSLDVNNLGAAYTNDEATFKSRDIAQTDAGPFLAGTRRRNGQRLAARNVGAGGTKLGPAANTVGVSGPSDDFTYSGVGQSTFRLFGDTQGSHWTPSTSTLGTPQEPYQWDRLEQSKTCHLAGTSSVAGHESSSRTVSKLKNKNRREIDLCRFFLC